MHWSSAVAEDSSIVVTLTAIKNSIEKDTAKNLSLACNTK